MPALLIWQLQSKTCSDAKNLPEYVHRFQEKPEIFKYAGQNCELQRIHLDVVPGDDGYAVVVWQNIPTNLINVGAAVVLFTNQLDQDAGTYTHVRRSAGSFKTSVPLSEWLHARLHRFGPKVMDEICRGKEFLNSESVPITSYAFAQLQLFAKNGYSCFRLHIDNCNEWRSYFDSSWVALYTSAEENTKDYLWQWVTKFEQNPYFKGSEYKQGPFSAMFEYCTGTAAVPGLQARFMIKDYEKKPSLVHHSPVVSESLSPLSYQKQVLFLQIQTVH
ncbi:hypothetical protein WMY93_005392 [Mugilogobius chulae]|uniref:Uncharacterized protein n=1 Tax=Mugilogobius chulae TaxID=88201 RepID=A0AAW0PQN3_9GOBI